MKIQVNARVNLVNIGHTSSVNCELDIDMVKHRLKFEDLEEYVTNVLEKSFNGEIVELHLEESIDYTQEIVDTLFPPKSDEELMEEYISAMEQQTNRECR